MNKTNIVSMIVVAFIAIIGFTGTANAFYLGQRGQEVVDLQITLIEAGFDIPLISSGVATPGYFGTQTQSALVRYTASQASRPVLGAVSGPDLQSPYWSVDGVRTWYTRKAFVAPNPNGTTTPCAIRSPTATSSLIRANVNITTSTTTAGIWALATSTTQYATTTPYQTFTVTGGKLLAYEYIASSTTSGSERIFAPNTWLVWSVAGASQLGASNYGHIYGGTCQVEFREF